MRTNGGAAPEVPEWVITFADLMTLLFCFFVLLTTLSTQPKSCDGLMGYLQKNALNFKDFELHSSKTECILSLPSDYLFSSGRAEIQQRALVNLSPMFREIRTMEDHKNDMVIVEGHTDDVPIKTQRFQSNWELSSARATNFATYLVKIMQYPPDLVSIRAFAENKPKVPYHNDYNDPLTGRELSEARKINRRVEIILTRKPDTLQSTNLLFDGRY